MLTAGVYEAEFAARGAWLTCLVLPPPACTAEALALVDEAYRSYSFTFVAAASVLLLTARRTRPIAITEGFRE